MSGAGNRSTPVTQTRRRVLSTMALAGAAALTRPPTLLAAGERLETTSIRIGKSGSICIAPQYVAEDLLRAEGFTDIRYVDRVPTVDSADVDEIDITAMFASSLVLMREANRPITILGGLHIGCFELFGTKEIRRIADLKGKRVAVPSLGGSPWHAFISVIVAQVGLDPTRDLNWVVSQDPKPPELFAAGKADAFIGFPPDPQEMRAREIGHVVVNSALDRPWADYFCCLIYGNRDFVRNNPVATKRAMRAILKSADFCADDPSAVARRLVDGRFTPRYDYAVQTMRELPYGKWREYDAEDSLRFYALRLHEAELIKSSPQKIIAGGTDWRFFNELKRELKA